MRTHQNTLLALKLSTLLLSLTAVVLIVMLLTGSVLAKRSTEEQKSQAVIQSPSQPTKTSTPAISRVVMVYVVTATPSVTAPLSPMVKATHTAPKPAVATASDLPAMPELAAIPEVPDVPAPAPRSSGGGGSGGGNSSAPVSQSQPKPQPQPQVTTKTS
jgi:hypothetical protein